MWVQNYGGGGGGGGKHRGRAGGFYAYPGNGYYPLSRLHGKGWSICAGADFPPGEPEIHVFQLTARPDKPLNSVTMPRDAKEIKIGFQKRNTEAGWMTNWVVFEPEVKPATGDIYWVSFKGGAVRIGYAVEFTDDKF
jgi:hypothetical protein